MKYLSIIFLILFSFLSVAKSEDIREFEIEGISIGDSLLDFMSVKDIKKMIKFTKRHYKYLKEPLKFSEVYLINDPNFKTYTNLSFFVKSNDSNYTVHSIRGMKNYINNIDSCLKQRNKISKEIENIINKYEKYEATAKNQLDKSGKSYTSNINYDLYSGDQIVLACNDWEEKLRKKNNWVEGLSVVLHSNDVKNWLIDF
tara:strand:- start:65 stop:664 length:600 start_codon:yes stop_codon:yes gene_type:complete